ncbi:tRNA epoxyqueuosine(34) reductase QueG [Vibrio breoganii]|uniref:Epoxyqueuosine reductase n=1 Tax=Vibrio breoganii TaxID=553239 RepID=A0ABX1UAA5_9VIBR|nr:tRNA epoxyqueuosine(34) reductase QueG [Vibrio breoganii]NMO72788.1 tRNA epoxyqueuosine(34) reductase QueG [Vibrio breoganii]NMR71423.1 tRNA epoxyqueuosine(34) reductase QueG [Vibrio breoganii]PML87748.1 tRNA epoxyqueuosine(34) reductase QueG [Vibrio breoganii]PML96198.1 tRNA epoxyqueuosine(34) reductase QueG [Vibrio breoganii]PMN61663.1 tRNA epoxyqueuosine(34) reductase QueG [Vibrio breoganii]
MNLQHLADQIKLWGNELGFQKIGITDVDLSSHEEGLKKWIAHGYHGSMEWMERNEDKRLHPDKLHPGTLRVISVRLDYLPPDAHFASNLSDPSQAYISRYALGRDYHKLMRNKLKNLARKIEDELGELNYRPFVDSAPVLERPLAEKAGLGWTGKHSLLLDEEAGSWFFLGELLIGLPLPVDAPVENQCGKCRSCITSCPTGAIIEDGVIDARKCISYLTIEYDGIIEPDLSDAMGNRIYGCDDCQLVCPFNRHAQLTQQADFHRRESIKDSNLITLLLWSEQEFLKNFEGSAIRRIGHLQWLRNLAIALGNGAYSDEAIITLESRLGLCDVLDHHIAYAIERLKSQTPFTSTKQQRLIRIVQKGLPRDA